MQRCLSFIREDAGATAVEYGVMLALILVAIITAISTVGISTGGLFNSSQTQMTGAGLGQ